MGEGHKDRGRQEEIQIKRFLPGLVACPKVV